jgi:hypothetical protein
MSVNGGGAVATDGDWRIFDAMSGHGSSTLVTSSGRAYKGLRQRRLMST